MNAQTQIAQHLKIEASAITRCEEWANVWFVVASGLGARFVSKKVVKMSVDRKEVGPREYAHLVVDEIKKQKGNAPYKDFSPKVWLKKEGETRVYIGEYGYYAIFDEEENGSVNVIYKVKSYFQDFVRGCVAEIRKEYKLVLNPPTLVSKDPLSQLCSECRVNDAMIGSRYCCDCID